MKERPIFMAPENAQKCHEGTKTQTRRIVSVPSWASDDDMLKLAIQRPATGIAYYMDGIPEKRLTCPYGQVGDRLWVREPWAWPGEEKHLYKGCHDDCPQVRWTPSIHMPRWACRTVLEITDVRVERLQEISEEDAKAEGCHIGECGSARGSCNDNSCRTPATYRQDFQKLWESINASDSWARNPWVWVIAFRKVGACER